MNIFIFRKIHVYKSIINNNNITSVSHDQLQKLLKNDLIIVMRYICIVLCFTFITS